MKKKKKKRDLNDLVVIYSYYHLFINKKNYAKLQIAPYNFLKFK